MQIDDLTIGEAKQLAAMLAQSESQPTSPHIGKKCVIRTYASGVHFGELVSVHGRHVELKNARRLYRWHAIGGISLSEVARNGIHHKGSKVCRIVPEHSILDGLEVIPADADACLSIMTAEVYAP